MIHLKKLKLNNYCGYCFDTDFDFSVGEQVLPINLFYGPNGAGKSNAINAISLVTCADQYMSRPKTSCQALFRKTTYHSDYDPTMHEVKVAEGVTVASADMRVEGIFNTNAGTKKVIVSTDGVEHNDFHVAGETTPHSIFIDADNPTRMRRFQVPENRGDVFLELAEVIYGFPCKLGKNMQHYDDVVDYAENFFTDFIIQKTRRNSTTNVHFNMFSAGEKKIATFIRYLLKPEFEEVDIAVVDNLDMHVYFKRHADMINKMLEVFPNTQFFVTTHSPTMIDHVGAMFGEQCLFDLEKILN